MGKRVPVERFRLQRRGGKGLRVIPAAKTSKKGVPRQLKAMVMTVDDEHGVTGRDEKEDDDQEKRKGGDDDDSNKGGGESGPGPQEVLLVTSQGVMNRMTLSSLRVIQNRVAIGVKLMKLDPGDSIQTVSLKARNES